LRRYRIQRWNSDIPKSGEHVKWSRPGALVPAGNKLQVTLRLDADVLSFFKKTGERYQTRINAVLREYMRRIGMASDLETETALLDRPNPIESLSLLPVTACGGSGLLRCRVRIPATPNVDRWKRAGSRPRLSVTPFG
jgi:hypothetical protein